MEILDTICFFVVVDGRGSFDGDHRQQFLGLFREDFRLIDVMAHEEKLDGVFKLFVFKFVGEHFDFFG